MTRHPNDAKSAAIYIYMYVYTCARTHFIRMQFYFFRHFFTFALCVMPINWNQQRRAACHGERVKTRESLSTNLCTYIYKYTYFTKYAIYMTSVGETLGVTCHRRRRKRRKNNLVNSLCTRVFFRVIFFHDGLWDGAETKNEYK